MSSRQVTLKIAGTPRGGEPGTDSRSAPGRKQPRRYPGLRLLASRAVGKEILVFKPP